MAGQAGADQFLFSMMFGLMGILILALCLSSLKIGTRFSIEIAIPVQQFTGNISRFSFGAF
jgi:hypothetical protein